MNMPRHIGEAQPAPRTAYGAWATPEQRFTQELRQLQTQERTLADEATDLLLEFTEYEARRSEHYNDPTVEATAAMLQQEVERVTAAIHAKLGVVLPCWNAEERALRQKQPRSFRGLAASELLQAIELHAEAERHGYSPLLPKEELETTARAMIADFGDFYLDPPRDLPEGYYRRTVEVKQLLVESAARDLAKRLGISEEDDLTGATLRQLQEQTGIPFAEASEARHGIERTFQPARRTDYQLSVVFASSAPRPPQKQARTGIGTPAYARLERGQLGTVVGTRGDAYLVRDSNGGIRRMHAASWDIR